MAAFPGTNIEVIRRVNRPSPSDKVSLELIILNNGTKTEPYEVCAVYVFPKVIGNDSLGLSIPLHYFQDASATSSRYGIVATAAFNTSCDFVWSGNAGYASAIGNTSTYDATTSAASAIYRKEAGHYAVVLQSDASCTISGTLTQNAASATGTYFDVWEIVNVNGSNAQLYINEFELFNDNFVGLVEPLQFTANTVMHTKRMQLGSIQRLIFGTSIVVLNTNINDEIKAVIDKSVLSTAQLQITKYHEDNNLPNFVTVSGYSDTSGSVEVTSDDSISFLLDTTTLSGISNIGRSEGIYHAKVKFTLFDQTFVSEEFPFRVD